MTRATRSAALALAVGLVSFASAGDIVAVVRAASDARNFALAEQRIQSYRTAVGVTPELLEAQSWLARGLLESGQYDRADGYAGETRKLVEGEAGRNGRGDAALAVALGAAIEVHAQVLAARGARPEAIAFLEKELAVYRETGIAPRIQKNINLLSLVGKPAPALDISQWLGPQPRSLGALKGHPVLLFFWAHWCGDCKGEAPILARLIAAYGPKGLLVVAPTQLYGYTAESDAAPAQELQYIAQVRKQYYGALANVPVPVSGRNFQRYGCSTTPTLVLLDASGIVRLYHPGAMTYEALADQVRRVLGARAP